MNKRAKNLLVAVLLGSFGATLATPSFAHDRDDWRGRGHWRHHYRGYYVAPAPVYVQPAPVYVQPAPVYVQPAPVYVPPPAYYYPPVRRPEVVVEVPPIRIGF